MSRADRLNEEIGWLKVVFAVCVALDASLVAWLAQNYEGASPVLVLVASGAALLLAGLVVDVHVHVNGRVRRRLEELEDV